MRITSRRATVNDHCAKGLPSMSIVPPRRDEKDGKYRHKPGDLPFTLMTLPTRYFNDIIHAIADMDADVITIETSRSQMELLEAFSDFKYPNEMGPGVYDIHSPRVPSVEEMVELLEKATGLLPARNIWVNPDCGLKTRKWPETEAALKNMVAAATQVRAHHHEPTTA